MQVETRSPVRPPMQPRIDDTDPLALAARLAGFPSIARPVVDRTGLDGLWDFEVKFMPTNPEGSESPLAPPIINALQEQLGLKLESTRAPVEVLVIDSAEMPSEN